MSRAAERLPYDASAITAACIQAWMIGSLTLPFAWLVTELLDISPLLAALNGAKYDGSTPGLAAAGIVLLPFVALPAAFLMLPYMLLVAVPVALALAPASSHYTIVNVATGAAIGFAAEFMLRAAGLVPDSYPMPLGPYYGGVTAYFVARTFYA